MLPERERVYLGVGSNVGDRNFFLRTAQDLTHKLPQTRLLRSSSVFETDPVGGPPEQGKFLNAVWEIETGLSPQGLKKSLQGIEAQLGRARTVKNAAREIDLDILFYGNHILKEDRLEIPHPRLHERAFVLMPLSELVPEKIHPQIKKTVKELLESLPLRAR